jgi:hypothetical protein
MGDDQDTWAWAANLAATTMHRGPAQAEGAIRSEGLVLVNGRYGGQVWVYAYQHTADQFGAVLEPTERLIARAEAFAQADWLREHGCLPYDGVTNV